MSWARVGHPSEVVNVGDQREGRRPQVRSRARARVARHEADHARSVEHACASASRSARACTARCVSLTDYGAFVELEPGIEGLVHVSEMSWTKRVTHPVEGARGRAGGRRPGARRRSEQPPHLARPEADRAESVGDGAHQPPGRQPHQRQGEEHHRLRRSSSSSRRASTAWCTSPTCTGRRRSSTRPSSSRRATRSRRSCSASTSTTSASRSASSSSPRIRGRACRKRYPGRARACAARSPASPTSASSCEIEEGVEGLIHVSQLSHRAGRPAAVALQGGRRDRGRGDARSTRARSAIALSHQGAPPQRGARRGRRLPAARARGRQVLLRRHHDARTSTRSRQEQGRR